jgi:hypothetical protein
MKNLIFTAAALAALTLASCIKSPDVVNPEDEMSNVAIGISLPSAGSSTRTVGVPISDNTTFADLEDGHVFLYTESTGIIYSHIVLYREGNGIPTYGSKKYTFEQITAKYNDPGSAYDDDYVLVESVPGTVDKCMVVLNAFTATGDKLIAEGKVGANISTVEGLVAYAKSFNIDATINHVPLVADKGFTNVDPVDQTGGTNQDQSYNRKAEMNVGAIGTRVQIGKLSAQTSSNGTKIQSYTVEGIFINNFYPSMQLDGGYGSGATIVDNGATEAGYTATQYGAGTSGETLADMTTTQWTTGTNGVTAPAAEGGYWVYNLVPNGEVPHILVKLTNVVAANSEDDVIPITDNTRWLTIKSYKEDGTSVTKFLANHMYTLANVEFDYDDTTDNPSGENANVAVHIDVDSWTNHNVIWD